MGAAFEPVLSLGSGPVSWTRLLAGRRVAALLVAGLSVAHPAGRPAATR
jgi:hypothetical protein